MNSSLNLGHVFLALSIPVAVNVGVGRLLQSQLEDVKTGVAEAVEQCRGGGEVTLSYVVGRFERTVSATCRIPSKARHEQ